MYVLRRSKLGERGPRSRTYVHVFATPDYPPSPPAHSFVLGTAVITNNKLGNHSQKLEVITAETGSDLLRSSFDRDTLTAAHNLKSQCKMTQALNLQILICSL
jgi:hypothetical protein